MPTFSPFSSLFLLLFLNFLFLNSNAYKYLMISLNVAYSHLEFDGRVADLLVERGHEVDFLVAKISPFIQGNGTKKATNIFEFVPLNLNELNGVLAQLPLYGDVFEEDMDVFSPKALPIFKKAAHMFCYEFQNSHSLFHRLQQNHYDAALIEDDSCFKVLLRRLGIRNIMILTPTALSEIHSNSLGLPLLPSFVPVLNHSPVSPIKMTFLERMYNFYETWRSIWVVNKELNELFDDEGPLRGSILPLNFPKISEINQDITAWFVNTFEAVDLPRPLMPKLHHVGGLTMKDNVELDEKTSLIFKKAKKGVVLVSFGSVVDTTKMKAHILHFFIKSFSKFSDDYKFIWKFGGAEDKEVEKAFSGVKNVHLFEWVNQRAILANPKTVLFISHVGLNSLNEAIYSGVPLLALPFFCDQTYNAAIVDHNKLGIVLDKRKLSEKTLTNALNELLNGEGDEKEFKTHSTNIAQMVRQQTKDITSKFLDQVEFSTKFASQLKRQNFPTHNFLVYYSLDVVLFLFVSIGSFVIVVGFLIVICLRRIFNLGSRVVKKIKGD